jgi:iron complex outermembrane recepter protein
VAAIAASSIVQAQQAALEEVIVTAERRSEHAQDVPIAISAMSSLDPEARGIRQAGDIAASVPNLLLGSPYGEEAQPANGAPAWF